MKTIILSFLFLSIGLGSHAQLITTIAGNGTIGYSGDGGPATLASFGGVFATVADKMGNIYIADYMNYRIRKVDLNGIVTTVAGTGVDGYSGDGGPATAAKMSYPYSLAIDTAGNLYFPQGAYIRKVSTAGIITTIAGTGVFGNTGDGGPATSATIMATGAIAADRFGNIYFSDITTSYLVRKIDAAGIITTFAGDGTTTMLPDGVPATASSAGKVYSIAIDTTGNIYFAAGSKVRMVNTSGIISTFAGGTFGYSGDGGPATAAGLRGVTSVVADNFGNVYIAENQNHTVRRVDKDGIIHTFAGNNIAGFSGDGGPATAAQLYSLGYGLSVIGKGAVFIPDITANERIRAVDHPPYFTAGGTYTITACADTPYIAMDTLLAVMDSNTAQPLRWSIGASPMHGTLTAADTLHADTVATLPSGTRYTPTGTYTGLDSFKVVVSDGIMRDTIAVYIKLVDCKASVALTNSDASQFSIYPNPVTDGSFTCELTSAITQPAYLTITDVTGRLVKELTTTTNKTVTISMDALPGVYLVRMRTDDGTYIQRVTLMR